MSLYAIQLKKTRRNTENKTSEPLLRFSLIKAIIGKAKEASTVLLMGVGSFLGALGKIFKIFNLIAKKMIFFSDSVLIWMFLLLKL